VVLKHGGRVYLAKDACLTRESFEQMYPNLARFKEVKARLDPEGRFTSSLARRLGIGAPEGA
jgi:FAD/FMN-containing dehydrogenase